MKVLLVGSGMIAHDQILPSLYQLERRGRIEDITVCSIGRETLDALAANPGIRAAFPGHSFTPTITAYQEVIAALPQHSLVVVAIPDQLHYDAVMCALRHDQHVLCVKPLVLRAEQTVEIEREARSRGLLVAVEYHKRFDDRSNMARQRYRAGLFGEFKLGTACLLEKWYYRHSNFQNWCTTENSDAFTYIGCHYVDLVHFITGLTPKSVSLYGVKDRFPNGNEGYLWTDARVIWSNGAALNVQNALGFPDDAPGPNTQGLVMYCANQEKGGWLAHSDQYRGLQYCQVDKGYSEPSPDYFQYIDLGGPGLTPAGYGYRSIEYIAERALELRGVSMEDRARRLASWDRAGIMATPANSGFNDAVIEAARDSIVNGGRTVDVTVPRFSSSG
jgi:D-galacturonate reductase